MRMRYWVIDLLMRTELWAIRKGSYCFSMQLQRLPKERGPGDFYGPTVILFNLTREVGLSYAKLLLHRQRNY